MTDGPHLLDSLPYLTLVHVVTTGGPQHEYFADLSPPHFGELNQTLDAKGFYTNGNCRAGVYVSIGLTSIGYCTGAVNPPETDKWTIAEGQERVTWNPIPTDIWNFNTHVCGPGVGPCFTYDGSFTVTIDRLPATLSMVPNRYVVVAPGAVSITAKATPSFAQGFTVPFTVQSWTWTPDGGTAGSVCGTSAVCNLSPSSSGTIKVNAIVNGVPQTKSAHIRVLCKSTGDSLLDSLPILDAMKAAEAASGDPNVPGNQLSRRENSFTVQCDASGECGYTVTDLGTPCGGTPPPVGNIPGIITEGHTHPFNPAVPNPNGPGWVLRNPATDSLPEVCKHSKGTKGSGPEPSDSDYVHVESINNGPNGIFLPHYVLDPDNILVIPGGNMPMAARQAGLKKIPRKQGNCQII